MGKAGLLDRIFPPNYDFYEMLGKQALANSGAIAALIAWLDSSAETDARKLADCAADADMIRKDMERKLVEAFSTPFDRGDLYSISVTMHRSLEYASSTFDSMQAFCVPPDSIIRSMAAKLKLGAETFASAVAALKSTPEKAEQFIPPIRAAHMDAEQLYRDGMCDVFDSGDAMNALRHREVYHHLKDASKHLDNAVDILHRIIVRLT